MAVALVQKNGAGPGSVAGAGVPPAWGATTTAGNLLLICGYDTSGTAGTWNTTPSGYTLVTGDPFSMDTTPTVALYGIYWKIAAGSDATPGNYGQSTGATNTYITYTYEFSSTTGWNVSPFDTSAGTAASATAVVTKASGSTATLAQASELAVAVFASKSVAASALTFSNGYTVDRPTSPSAAFWFGWKETSATTAESTTASWTGSESCGVRVATFKTASAAAARPGQRVVRRVGAGR